MPDIQLLEHLGAMVAVATAVTLLLRRLRVPTIISYILAGLLVGTASSTLLYGGERPQALEAIRIIGEVGIVLLLFLVGLELSFIKIKDVGKVAVVAGLGQVVFTAAGGLVLSLALGYDLIESIFLATALTFSSTVVVVKLLDQKKELHSLYGRISVGIFLVQDLVVIIVLTLLAGLGSQEMEAGTTLLNVGEAFVKMGILLAMTLLAAKFVLPKPFSWAALSAETVFVWGLCWCFTVVVTAEALDLSPEIGAFLAGLSLAQLPCGHDLQRRLHPLMNVFVAVFFISLGAGIQPESAFSPALLGDIGVLSLFVLIGNPVIFIWLIARCGYGEKVSFLSGVTVAQISEFSFIFAAAGVARGLIGEQVLAVTTGVGLVTIAVSAYMILYNGWLYERLRGTWVLRPFRAAGGVDEEDKPAVQLKNHIVVVGMNALGRLIVAKLKERGETVLAVDTDARKLQGLDVRQLVGSIDLLPVVEEAALANARLVISTLQIEDTNNLLAYRCREMGVPCAIHAFDRSVIDDLKSLEVDFLIDPRSKGVERVSEELARAGVLPG